MKQVKSAVVGIGEVPSGKFPDRSELEAAMIVCREAILDAGLSPRDIDVILPVGALANSHWQVDLVFSRLCEELGMLRSVKITPGCRPRLGSDGMTVCNPCGMRGRSSWVLR